MKDNDIIVIECHVCGMKSELTWEDFWLRVPKVGSFGIVTGIQCRCGAMPNMYARDPEVEKV